MARFYTIDTNSGGGHTWPDGLQYLPASLADKTARTLDASDVIWQFFSRYTLGNQEAYTLNDSANHKERDTAQLRRAYAAASAIGP